MSWERWRCPTCGQTIELNELTPLEAWCSRCHAAMLRDDDEAEA
jgi:endogenous inhibitor of DNA gyrase (YacG/DUF329 family)